MEPLKVAIVGTGRVAQSNYLPYLSRQPGVSLGYFNRTAASAQACAGQFGGRVFDSVADLMAWDPDTVFILTRENDRYAAACAVLEHRPRRLFFEKPLVGRNGQENVDEADFYAGRRLLAEAERCGCETAMIFNYRFFDHTISARRLAAERDFGAVMNVAGLTHYACWSHCIDLVHYFAGPLEEVCAVGGQIVRQGGPGMQAPDLAASFRTQAGAVGTLLGTAGPAWEFPLFELAFNFERGRVRLQDLDGDLEVMDNARGEHERFGIPRDRSRWAQYNSSFEKSVAAYLASIREGQAPPVPGRFGLLELQVEAGFHRSIALGRPVRLAEELPLAEK